MINARFVIGCLVTLTAELAGQDDAVQLQEARHQLVLRHLDSARVLLQIVHDDRDAPVVERATAFVLDGVVRFYQGKDSLAARAFRSALALDSATVPPPIFAADSALGALWLTQVAASASPTYPPDTLFTCLPRCVGLDEGPRLIGGFEVGRMTAEAGADLNQYGERPDRAEATFRMTIDTLGRVEPASVEVVSSTLPRVMVDQFLWLSQDARFSPGRVRRRAVRVRLEYRVTMRPVEGR